MKLVPMADRVVLKMHEAEEMTKSGILLSSAAKEKPTVAEVVAVGPGGMVDGNEIKMTLAVGDQVVLDKYAGTTVTLEGEDFVVVREKDVIAKVQ